MNANKRIILNSDKIVYPDLSYRIMGIFFDIHTKLGNELQEKIYQRAIEKRLLEQKIPFIREFHLPIQDGNRFVGKYFLDFVVDNKIAIELKTLPTLTNSNLRQLLAYLQVAKLKLGILVNFRTRRLTYERFINPNVSLK